MAEIKSIGMENGTIEITLIIDRNEYGILQNHMTDLVILPCGKGILEHELTTGKLGNSNRIMLPKKLLQAFKISRLEKKVPSKIFNLNGESYLLIKIKKSRLGIPQFKEETA